MRLELDEDEHLVATIAVRASPSSTRRWPSSWPTSPAATLKALRRLELEDAQLDGEGEGSSFRHGAPPKRREEAREYDGDDL
jgi:hypothetical protein